MSPDSPTRRARGFAQAMEEIWDGIALLRYASASLPVEQRHVFVQAVNRLVGVASEVAGLFEPVEVASGAET